MVLEHLGDVDGRSYPSPYRPWMRRGCESVSAMRRVRVVRGVSRDRRWSGPAFEGHVEDEARARAFGKKMNGFA